MFKEDLIINFPDTSEFAFNGEWLTFFGICILLVATLVFTLSGYKHFVSPIALLIICCLGYMGYKVGAKYTDSPVFMLVFVISFAFLGCMLIYLLGNMFFVASTGMKVKEGLVNNMYLISSFFGAGIFTLLTYLFIFNNLMICIGLFLLLFIIGFFVQKKHKAEQVKFHTYDDLYYKEKTNEEV